MRCSPRSSLSRPLFFIRGSAPFSMAPSPVGGPSETAGLGDVVGASWMTLESAMALTTPGAGWLVRRQSGTSKMRYERLFRRFEVNRGKEVQAAARQEKGRVGDSSSTCPIAAWDWRLRKWRRQMGLKWKMISMVGSSSNSG